MWNIVVIGILFACRVHCDMWASLTFEDYTIDIREINASCHATWDLWRYEMIIIQ